MPFLGAFLYYARHPRVNAVLKICFFFYIVEPEVGTSGGVIVSKLDQESFTSEFESHSYGLVPHLNKQKSFVNYLSGFKLS